jgi:hypothetical protein
MSPGRVESICAWVAVIAILLGACSGNTNRLHRRPELLPYDLNSPILAMELLKDCKDLPLVVGQPRSADDDREEMKRLTYRDYAFIASYFLLFLSVGFLLVKKSKRPWGLAVMLLGSNAAVFDLLENSAILKMLATCSSTPRSWSLIKWALIFSALACTAKVFLDSLAPLIRRAIGWVAALLCLLSALFGLAGVFLHAEPFIETGANAMAIALIVGWLYFSTHNILAQGLMPFLNRLATSRLLGWLTTWPSDES